MSQEQIALIHSDGSIVEAKLLDGLKPPDLLMIEREWGPVKGELLKKLLVASVPREKWPQSLNWDWSKKAAELRFLEASGFGVVCEERWQGAMLTKSASHFARDEENRGRPLLYIDYLEVAPWNWNIAEIGQQRRFKAVGSILFKAAIELSERLGFHGRIGLHSLPQAEHFYDSVCMMTRHAKDSTKENLVYFELSPQGAKRILLGS
jgi:hypothetical protein